MEAVEIVQETTFHHLKNKESKILSQSCFQWSAAALGIFLVRIFSLSWNLLVSPKLREKHLPLKAFHLWVSLYFALTRFF